MLNRVLEYGILASGGMVAGIMVYVWNDINQYQKEIKHG